uniref:Putative phage-related protein, KorB DNA-binding domain-like n=1 Tax=blood disease bacterium R229 TaxID=741978 RepID=G2ZTV1_9RALS
MPGPPYYAFLGALRCCACVAELANEEKVDRSYVSRMINLTTLAPDIQAAILNETLPEEVALFDLAVDTPQCWEAQRRRIVEVAARAGEGKALPGLTDGSP